MMEPVEFKRSIQPEALPEKPWATTGAKDRKPNIINSLHLAPESLEAHNWKLAKKYEEWGRTECRHEEWHLDGDLDVLFVAYGTVARICKTAIDALRAEGVKAGLFRPISLFPYPGEALARAAEKAKYVLVSELSCGQMLEDVRYALAGKRPVTFYGRVGGMIMTPEELVAEARKLVGKQA
jgi:2-oxoglutarate/2-oxoacid ferredoxin oxidoreductase subunit alpha